MRNSTYIFGLLFGIVFFVLNTSALADIFIINTAVNPANGHIYYLVAATEDGSGRFAGVSWSTAEDYAQSQFSSHLATVNDAAENEWILNTFNNHYTVAIETGDSYHFQDERLGLFIGYNDAAQEGQWQWVSGETPAFENWMPGEPNGAYPDDAAWLADYALLRPLEVGDESSWGQWLDEYDVPSHIGTGGYVPNYGLIEVIPEPATLGLLLLGGLALLRGRRRFRPSQ